MLTLTIPPRRDPAPRVLLLALVGAVVLLGIYSSAAQPASAERTTDPIIIVATPALPTPPADQPALGLAAPTAAPSWVDQALATAGDAANQFADEQADLLAQEQAASAAQAAADREQYLLNVGAQAPHSPRGDVLEALPSYQAGPSEVAPGVIIDPNPQPPAASVAVMAPQLSADQAAVLAERQSNTCAAGEVFYPRTGCHAPGSGGVQPGAVSR